ncbi:MAG: hypothetical protein M3077_03805 [Candidatus Dormibacteraeota bacterium]|nr:hypothetical protein [Candidatus Dormibacteraeota bacterium]
MVNYRLPASRSGLILEAGAALATILAGVRWILDYSRTPCPGDVLYRASRLCHGWAQFTRGGAALEKAVGAIQADPFLQIVAAIAACLLVLAVLRRIFA